jgi:peroxiredoxin
MKRNLFVLTLVVCSAAVTLCQTALKIGSRAPEFSLSTLEGKKYALSELRGSIVVLTFWSTTCAICQSEMPKLDQMLDRYAGKNVVFLSATPENEERVKYYLSINQVHSTVLPNGFGVLLNYADRDREGNVNIGYPAFFVMDREGSVQYRGSGYSKTVQVGATIDKLLTK